MIVELEEGNKVLDEQVNLWEEKVKGLEVKEGIFDSLSGFKVFRGFRRFQEFSTPPESPFSHLFISPLNFRQIQRQRKKIIHNY